MNNKLVDIHIERILPYGPSEIGDREIYLIENGLIEIKIISRDELEEDYPIEIVKDEK